MEGGGEEDVGASTNVDEHRGQLLHVGWNEDEALWDPGFHS